MILSVYSAMIYKRAGIALAESKQEMVYSRLARRLRANGIVHHLRNIWMIWKVDGQNE